MIASAAAFVLAVGAAMPPPAAARPLAVPYLPQTEDLCGGAAAAMVMRYWGASDVYPDAFQPLVDASAGGIRSGALAADLRRRGWTAVAGAGDAGEVAKELGRRRPVIALVEDRPGRYHYVVVLGWDAGTVTLHDPARAPSRVVDAARFDAAWQKSGRWMLILLPPAASHADTPPATPIEPLDRVSGCQRLVADGVARATDDRRAARTLLTRATTICPTASAAWSEIAGLDALDGDWAAAASHARRAVAIDRHDNYAWRILATARYVGHDDAGALEAWNRVGEPVVDLIDVKGLDRTRFDVIAAAIGVEPRTVLRAEAMQLAERRVRDVPAVASAHVVFQPVQNNRVRIDASIVERDRAPWGYSALAGAAFDAASGREVSAEFSSPTGGGEVAGVTWRWWPRRPRIGGFFAAPAPRAIGGGTLRLEAFRETQTFGRAAVQESRTRVAMTLARWLTDRTQLTTGAGIERWGGRAADVALSYGVEHRRARDRVRIGATATHAFGARPFTRVTTSAAARTKASNAGAVLLGTIGYDAVTREAPLSVWPGADTGHASDVLLRAHPLIDDGIVAGGAFGRRLAFATVEGQRWTALQRLPVRLAPAVFVDAARAARRLDAGASPLLVDAGAGIRVALTGNGVMRFDVAHGLGDGGTVLSAGWDVRWR